MGAHFMTHPVVFRSLDFHFVVRATEIFQRKFSFYLAPFAAYTPYPKPFPSYSVCGI